MDRGPGNEMIFSNASVPANIPAEIRALPYFFAELSDSNSATQYLEQHASRSGDFLLRLSSKGDNYLSISVNIANSSVRHVNVQIEREPTLKYYIVKELKFDSFRELRDHYMDHRICNVEQIENVKLIQPLLRQTPRTSSLSNGNLIPEFVPAAAAPPTPTESPQANRDPVPVLPRSAIKRKDSASRPLPSPPSGDQRPPCPPPVTGESNLYYSRVRDVNKNRLHELQQTLKSTEKREKCDCGIPMCDSVLPHGWSLHKSNDSATFDCLFYQNSQGDTTWKLPPEIVNDITETQRNIIINLSRQSGKPPPEALKVSFNIGGRNGPPRSVGGLGGPSPDVVPQIPGVQGQNSGRGRGQGSSMNWSTQEQNRL